MNGIYRRSLLFVNFSASHYIACVSYTAPSMLPQRSIISAAHSIVKKCTKTTARSVTALHDRCDGRRTINTGTYCRQRQVKGDIFSLDPEHRTRRSYVEQSDFAHPKGLRFSSSPLEKASQTFENKDDEDIVSSVATQIPVPDFDVPQTDTTDYIEKISSVKFHGLETDFPCLAKRKGAGPEPMYHKVVTGYKVFHHPEKFLLKHRNGVLPELDIAYETWGELNENRDNAIMLYTGLSASSHAKSHEDNQNPGWWEKFIGPGCALDTNKFFIICSNNLGGCYGTTGPSSINPLTGEPYGTTFPIVTVEDQIRAIFLLLDHLGIDKLYASVGSSLGGMQSLAASVLIPERVKRVVSISGTAQTHPSTIALRYLQRKAIMMDPNWNHGHYYNTGKFPIIGMKLAREIATITYRSGPEWDQRFGRSRVDDTKEPDLCPHFTIENYIDYQGEQFAVKYDPNSLIYISKAMDLFDLSELFGSMHSALARVKVPVMIIGVKTDALIPIWQQREMAQQLQEAGNHQVTFYELNSIYGHDTFLLDLNGVGSGVKGFLETDLVERGRVRKPQKKQEVQS